MQDIERDMVKKSVEEDHKQLDHLFFQKCIKEQIECIMLLPIKEVQREVEEVVAKFFPIIECKDKEREDMDSILGNLISDIQDTCLHMIRIRKKFWQKCRKERKTDERKIGEAYGVAEGKRLDP
ncbi:unnamed protein product [Cuscuta europaea]|uniref:Uncharacterized protein n=1 Tax=Cuscuta europaea TaxID=41803 RepID=A0A9P0ZCR5_CUSEU|nr:unnamed protein product [Cuscuta europaea]